MHHFIACSCISASGVTMSSGALSQPRFLPALSPVRSPQPWAIADTVKSDRKGRTAPGPQLMVSNKLRQDQRAARSKLNETLRLIHCPKGAFHPMESLPQQRLHYCPQKSRRDHENRCHHITHKGNRYFNMVPRPGLLLMAGDIFLSPRQSAITSLCLAAVASTESQVLGSCISTRSPGNSSSCLRGTRPLHVGQKCYALIDTFYL